jgi:hypothetical protein
MNTNLAPRTWKREQLLAAYFQVTSIPKKCMNTSRAGVFFAFCCGLRM